MVIESVNTREAPLDGGVAVEAPPTPFAFGFPSGFRPIREGLLLCLGMAVFVTGALRLWRAHIRIPWAYFSDGTGTLESVQSIMQSGWNLHTARVGAPFVGSQVDFPAGGESVHWFTIKLLGYVLRSPAVVDNVYYVAGYFLVALVAYYVARYLGLSRAPAFFAAVLYSFLPYHQVHMELHVTRSAYYIVPLVVLVMLWLFSWRTAFYAEALDGSLHLRRRRVAIAVAICVVQGASDEMTSGFAITLFLVLGLLVAIAHRNTRPFRWAVIFAVAVGVTLLIANFPYLWARLTEGPNLAAGTRALSDQEYYGLRWVFMLLPIQNHVVPFLARLTAKADTGGYGEPGQALGVFGAVGFLVAAVACLTSSIRSPDRDSRLGAALRTCGLICLVAVLAASVGGLGFLVALTGFDQLRDWDRIVVIIGFPAVVAIALLFQRALRWTAEMSLRRGWSTTVRRALPGVIAVALATVGVVDQAPPGDVPTYATAAVRYGIDAQFFHQLEAMVPKGSMIFQYPIMVFPENGPVNNLYDYGEFIGYLHTSTLQWSYGAIKGRTQGDWQTSTYANLPITTQMAALSAIGFEGVWVDRDGYADGGAAFEGQLRPLLGAPALVSSDNRMAYYSLASMTAKVDAAMTPAQRKAFAAAVLTATDQQYSTGFYEPENDPGPIPARWGQQTAQLILTNVGSKAETINLSGRVEGNGPGELVVSTPSSTATVPMTTSHPTPFNIPLHLPRGKTTVTFQAKVPGPVQAHDPRQLFFRLAGVDTAPPAVHTALCDLEPSATRPLDCP